MRCRPRIVDRGSWIEGPSRLEKVRGWRLEVVCGWGWRSPLSGLWTTRLCDSTRCAVDVDVNCWSGHTGRVGYTLRCFAMLSSAVVAHSLSMPVGRIRRLSALYLLYLLCRRRVFDVY